MKQDLSPAVYSILCNYCNNNEFTPASMMNVSRPCGGMSMWIHAVREYFRQLQVTTPRPQPLDAVRAELTELRTLLQQKREDTLDTERKLAVLQNELGADLVKLRDRYDETLLPLQDLFFEAHKKFNAIYTSPKRERESHLLIGAPQ